MIRQLAESAFVRHVCIIMSGTMVAQAIPILLSPVLTRLYSPEEFGVFAVYASVAALISIAATGRYELAIMLPKARREAFALVVLTVGIGAAVALGSTVIVLCCAGQLASLINNEGLAKWLYLLPLSIIAAVAYQAFYYWLNRNRQFKQLSMGRVLQAVVAMVIACAMGFTHEGAGGLILGMIAGQGSAALFFIFLAWRADASLLTIDRANVWAQARLYLRFPKYSLPADSINVASNQAPLVLLSLFFGPAVAGFFSLTQRVLGAPISVIAKAVLDVFKERASRDCEKYGNCEHIYKRTFKGLCLLSFIPFVLLVLFAPDLFSLVFGGEWRVAGEYAQYLAPLFLLRFTASPLSYVLYIKQKQHYDLIWQSALFALSSGSIVLGYYMQSAVVSVMLFSVSYSLMYVIYLMMSYKWSQGPQTVELGV